MTFFFLVLFYACHVITVTPAGLVVIGACCCIVVYVYVYSTYTCGMYVWGGERRGGVRAFGMSVYDLIRGGG